jgi:hypothetical protein
MRPGIEKVIMEIAPVYCSRLVGRHKRLFEVTRYYRSHERQPTEESCIFSRDGDVATECFNGIHPF